MLITTTSYILNLQAEEGEVVVWLGARAVGGYGGL